MLSGYSFITDSGGTDTAVMAGYELEDLIFMIFFDTTVVIAALDSSIGVWFEGMVGNPSDGRRLSRARRRHPQPRRYPDARERIRLT